jgi:hypothetical protein
MSGENHLNLLNEAYAMYALTNPLHGDCFPSVPRMEREVVQMTASLLGGGADGVATVCGTMTSGGTESIMRRALSPSPGLGRWGWHVHNIGRGTLHRRVVKPSAFASACLLVHVLSTHALGLHGC